MSDFQNSVDIGNRALQHVGQRRMVSLTEDYKGAAEVGFCFDKLRKAELERNVWRFSIKHAALRAISPTSMNVVFGAYDATKTYVVGSVAVYAGRPYIANQAVPISTNPGDNPGSWEPYYGPQNCDAYAVATSYYSGEVVYIAATAAVYISLVSDNSDSPTTAQVAWAAATTYSKGDTVTYSAATWQSTLDLNLNNVPGVAGWQSVPATQPDQMVGQKWLKLGAATLTSIKIVFPIGSGPSNQTTTRNIYRLPAGFLRKAAQDPKAGSVSYLGAPSGLAYDDWVYEGDYITTRDTQVILLRFVADFTDVTRMNGMFCEGLAARIGMEVCETLTQSSEKVQVIAKIYGQFMGDARTVNAIQIGSEEPPEDDYVTCRL